MSDQDGEGIERGGDMLRQRRASGSKCSLLVGAGRQSSAVNLNRLGPDSDLKRLVEEVGSCEDKIQCLGLCCLCSCVSRSVCLCLADAECEQHTLLGITWTMSHHKTPKGEQMLKLSNIQLSPFSVLVFMSCSIVVVDVPSAQSMHMC